METVLRVWDLLMCEGVRTLHRIGVALLLLGERSLFGCSSEHEVLPARSLGFLTLERDHLRSATRTTPHRQHT